MKLFNRMRALLRNDKGQDLLEYALLVALVALVCYGAVQATGTNIDTIFTNISEKLGEAGAAGGQ